jgi:hypothetical protein
VAAPSTNVARKVYRCERAAGCVSAACGVSTAPYTAAPSISPETKSRGVVRGFLTNTMPKRARAAKKAEKAENSGDEGGSDGRTVSGGAGSKRRLSAGAADEALRGALECPVCYETMLPPILQCSSGHPVCTVCRAKLKKCPTCRRKLGNIRNLLLEKLAADQRIQLVCSFAARGCSEQLCYGDLSTHQEVCRFRPLTCPHAAPSGARLGPAAECTWMGSEGEIAAHLIAKHGASFEMMLPYESAGSDAAVSSDATEGDGRLRPKDDRLGHGRQGRDGVVYCMMSSLNRASRTNSHTRYLSLSRSRARSLSLSFSLSRSHSPPPSLPLSLPLSLSLAFALSHSHSLTLSISLSLSLSPPPNTPPHHHHHTNSK